MPETTMLEWNDLAVLAGMCAHARFCHGDYTSVSKQKKVRKWVEKHYAEQIASLSDGVRSYLLPENGDKEVLEFLSACCDEMNRRIKENCTPQALLLAPLGEAVQYTFQYLLDEDFGIPIEHMGENRIALLADNNGAYAQRLILENAVLSPGCADWEFINEMLTVEKKADVYILRTCGGNSDQEVVRFMDAHVQVTCYNCTQEQIFANDPWGHLWYLTYAITSKADIPGDYCNVQEKTLLPLLREIQQIGMKNTGAEYPLLTDLAQTVGCCTSAFEKMKKKWNRLYRPQLTNVLCAKEWEPLWRAIYEKICRSQEEYPVRVEQRCDAEQLKKMREKIQLFMHSQGFSGTYPDFRKTGDIHGAHLYESYGLTYLCAAEKKAQMYIRCVETLGGNDRTVVHFLCGTALKQKDSKVSDIIGCLFHNKGRRLFWWVRDYDTVYDEETTQSDCRIMQMAQIAVKKVQMQKLTKDERSLYNFGSADDLVLFWLWLLLGGGLFAVAMTAAFWVLGAVAVAVFGNWQEIPYILGEIPWGWMFAFCWLGFGLSMGLITLIAKRQ